MKHDENLPHYLIIDVDLPYLDKLKTRITEFKGTINHVIPLKKGCVSVDIEFENIHRCSAFLDTYGEYYFKNGHSDIGYK